MNARVEDVTEAAGVAKGTFYLYFPSWDSMFDLLRAWLGTSGPVVAEQKKETR